MEPITRRNLLAMVGAVGGMSILGVTIQEREISRRTGEEVALRVGQEYRLPGSKVVVNYSGMPYPGKILLTKVRKYSRGSDVISMYFPIGIDEINIDKSKFSVIEATPEQIILKYLGSA